MYVQQPDNDNSCSAICTQGTTLPNGPAFDATFRRQISLKCKRGVLGLEEDAPVYLLLLMLPAPLLLAQCSPPNIQSKADVAIA